MSIDKTKAQALEADVSKLCRRELRRRWFGAGGRAREDGYVWLRGRDHNVC